MFDKIKSGKGQGGFTLVELMIVVNIVGILSVISIQNGLTYIQRAREKVTKENLRILRDAMAMYSVDTNHFPEKIAAGDYAVGPTGADRGGSSEIIAPASNYLRKIPTNLIPGEDDNFPANWVTMLEDTDETFVTDLYLQRWDGWVYIYKLDHEEVGEVLVIRSGNDVSGVSFSEW
jgi:prepilin-type N-terminal cleavage/methylation domain-containing protein